jgi:hypothetical protein
LPAALFESNGGIMITLYKKEKTCTANVDQVELMKKAGWSTEAPKEKAVADKEKPAAK